MRGIQSFQRTTILCNGQSSLLRQQFSPFFNVNSNNLEFKKSRNLFALVRGLRCSRNPNGIGHRNRVIDINHEFGENWVRNTGVH